jgi:signal transduction histidine kinase
VLKPVSWLIRAGAYALVGIVLFTHISYGPMERPAIVVAFGLCGVLLTAGAVMGLRDLGSRPQRAVVMGLAATVSAAAAVQSGATTMVTLALMATIDAGTQIERAAGWGVFTVSVLGAEAGLLAGSADPHAAQGIPLLLAVGLLAGFNRRAHRVQAEQNRALLAQAEKLRAEKRRGAVLDERTRLAREIHGVLAHSLGALGIQIQAARALLTDHQDTGRAVDVLTTAQRIAADGLVETRRAVHALRTDAQPLTEELARMAAAHELTYGSRVALTSAGDAVPLPPDQTLALVRTAQESLTNAAKHAPRRPVTVDLRYGARTVTLTLANALGNGAPLSKPPTRPAARPRTGAGTSTGPGPGAAGAAMSTLWTAAMD